MLKYVSKFILDIMPSIAATVIGAFIVHTWINPRPATDAPKPAAAIARPAEAPAAETAAQDAGKDVAKEAGKESFKESKEAAKAADVKPNVKGGAARAPSVEKPASEKPAAEIVDDKRNASELARTALERLRASEEPHAAARADAAWPAVTAQQGAKEPQRLATGAPAVIAQPTMLPMDPPIDIAAPRYATSAEPAAGAEAEPHLAPPGDIPDLQRTAEAQPGGRTTIADDFVAATRSMLRAVLPK